MSTSAMPSTVSSGERRHHWVPAILLLLYLVFSITLYSICNQQALRVVWFVYLTISTLVTACMAFEAYDGNTLINDARKSLNNVAESAREAAKDNCLPSMHLIFDTNNASFAQNVAKSIDYPFDRLFITSLCQSGDFTAGGRTTYLTCTAQEVPERVAFCLNQNVPASDCQITAVFAGDQLPHPYAPRLAGQRMLQNENLDMIQGRSLLTSPGRTSVVSLLSILRQDMMHALLLPGRTLTWNVKVPYGTNAYWKTEALRKAAIGKDLSWTPVSEHINAIWDLSIISFSRCALSWGSLGSAMIYDAQQATLASLRYTKLVFSKRRPIKSRIGILYMLMLLQITAHAVLQFFCMALCMLIVHAPTSLASFTHMIHWPAAATKWFIVIGLVSMICTAVMTYRVRSEAVPLWAGVLFLIALPWLMLLQAAADVFAQLALVS
ncbi:hypothetical protein K470DRAFT_26692 [Piedraia hortae CBS 480.64]|uniref:Glycosyltransferase family 2 protein n=1 Tax=Piedraia hortae CBS 480.64 TaxID=1314780 RepID=A0A6A7C3B8_9PEZI|nr:hypothetical protein K470DRAFT_26692 [Piedraia hortae CBS 480.64]